MNSKKAITLLVLATLMMSMVPVVQVSAALAVPALTDADGTVLSGESYGDTVAVVGIAGEVPAGYSVELYWDSISAWDGTDGLLNSSTADSDGSYEIWFDVPEAVTGAHYLWVKDVTREEVISIAFAVAPLTDATGSSGLPDDELTAYVYGFDASEDVVLLLGDATGAYPPVNDADNIVTVAETLNTTDTGSDIDNYEGQLANIPVRPQTVVITHNALTYTDATTAGILAATVGGGAVGTVNYVTGELELDITDTGAALTITGVYQHYANDDVDDVYMLDDELAVNALGSATKTITIPAITVMASSTTAYTLFAYNGEGDVGESSFTIGPVITLSQSSGPTGTLLTVTGRGYDTAADTIVAGEIQIVDNAQTFDHASAVDAYIKSTPITITDGEWTADIYVPTVDETGNYEIAVSSGGDVATAGFEVLGLPGVTLTTSHGTSGQVLTISGYNFTAEDGEDVEFAVFVNAASPALTAQSYVIPAVGAVNKASFAQTLETDDNGEFSGTLTLPAVADANYEIVAYQDTANIWGSDGFRVSLMVVVLSSQSGPTGSSVTMTGSGFEGFANATIEGETLFGISSSSGTFSQVVYIPTLDVGSYTIVVTDETNAIAVEVAYEVTETTYLVIDPAQAPVSVGNNRYNMSLEGYYFTEEVANNALTFDLYNVSADGTADETWTLAVRQTIAPGVAATLNTNANFTAWFSILASTDMDLGTYHINVTDAGDLFAQISFELVSETETIANKDDVYAIGDIVGFGISNSFAQIGSYIEIMDPNGDMFWSVDAFAAGDWISSGDQVIVPYYLQTSNVQLMELASDAPIGTWSWTWYDNGDDEIATGTFVVESAAEDVVGGQVEDLAADIVDLVDDIAAVSDLVSDVTGEFDDVRSDIAAVADIAADAAEAATQAAEAVTAVAATANTASEAAADAAEAANAAKDAATGLTTLVYGAIGASLVAALAAIVSLMQISRRIAG